MEGYVKCACLFVTCFVVTVQGLSVDRDKRSRRRPINLVHDFDVEGFLKDFGYMDNIPAGIVGDELRSVFDRDLQVKDAIKDFQYFYGLKETGEVDHKTMRMMKLPRCGVPDKERNDDIRRKRSTAHRFTHLGSQWLKTSLTWKLTRPTYKLRTDDQKRAIRDAFQIWENVAPLRITETTGSPDMEIFFARGEHGDGKGNSFDGKSRVLAHAFGPGKAKISGDAHFDDDEDWTLKSNQGSDMLVVAAHEFGHSLGLGHSRDQGALMFPAYRGQDALTLGQDDIRAIQTLYGSRLGYTVNPRRTRPPPATRPPPRTRSPPRTRAPYRPPTTSAPTTTTQQQPCNVDFEAIVAGPQRNYYGFKEGSVFKFNNEGMEEGYPKRVHEVFPEAPEQMDLAFSVDRTSKIYIIKDKQVWRYTDLTLDEGFPFEFRRDHFPEAPRFTMSLTDDRGMARVIMFGATQWWFYNFDKVQDTRPFPYPISKNWRGVPRDVQYSVRWTDNNYYLITSNGHVVFDHNRRVASQNGLVSGIPPWMDKACNAIMSSESSSGRFEPLALITIATVMISQLLMW